MTITHDALELTVQTRAPLDIGHRRPPGPQHTASDICWPSPVTDPGFPRGGGANPPGEGEPTYDFAKFPKKCMKLKEFEPPGASLTPP